MGYGPDYSPSKYHTNPVLLQLQEIRQLRQPGRRIINVFSNLEANNMRLASEKYQFPSKRIQRPSVLASSASSRPSSESFSTPILVVENGLEEFDNLISIRSHAHLKLLPTEQFQRHHRKQVLKRLDVAQREYDYIDTSMINATSTDRVSFQNYEIPIEESLKKLNTSIENLRKNKRRRPKTLQQATPSLSTSLLQLNLDELPTLAHRQTPSAQVLPVIGSDETSKTNIVKNILENAEKLQGSECINFETVPSTPAAREKMDRREDRRPRTFHGKIKRIPEIMKAVRVVKTAAATLLDSNSNEEFEDLCAWN